MIEENFRLTRVFRRDEIDIGKHVHSTIRDVFKITNRRADDVECAGLNVITHGGATFPNPERNENRR